MARYGLSLVTGPLKEPVTLEEARRQCGLAAGVIAFDEDLTRHIAAARRQVEEDTGRVLISQTWELTIDRFPLGGRPVFLPKSPLLSVVSVKYQDVDNVEQTVATSVYKVLQREPAEIRLRFDQVWPEVYGEDGIIVVQFTAGYGAEPEDVPAGLRQAILLSVHHMFDPAEAGEIHDAYRALISTYIVGDEFHCYA